MNILALSDFHAGRPIVGERRPDLAATFLAKAVTRTTERSATPDLVVLLGDLAHNATPAEAACAIAELRAATAKQGIPLLAVPGNHDVTPELFSTLTGFHEGLVVQGGIGFFLLFDHFAADGSPLPVSAETCATLRQARRDHPALPIVLLSHAPCGEPFRPDAEALCALCHECGITLALSGHYHPGVPPEQRGATCFYTLPAVYRPPFRFARITLTPNTTTPDVTPSDDAGKTFRAPGIEIVQEVLAASPTDELIDYHAHTEFAYCGRGIRATALLDLARTLGLRKQGLVEHACALYFNRAHMMAFDWLDKPDFVQSIWETPTRHRMTEYRRWVATFSDGFALKGLEVDLFDHGRLALAPQDTEGWDYIIGAIHEIQGITASNTQAEAEVAFMRDVEAFMQHPIKILAHPMRYFTWHHRTTPTHLYRPVARLLKAANIAAEINYHKNPNDPLFFSTCLEEGVKLSFGTDAHVSSDAANLAPHVALLEQLGITTPEARAQVLLQYPFI